MRQRQLKIGDVIAGRKVVALIGRGGMGVVYRAWNERLERDEALKVIADELAKDRSFRERFLREAKTAVALEHPHVIPVYDAAEEPDGTLFMAMRYVKEGKTLATLIQERGRLEPSLAAKLISDIASALDSGHAQGLVHRDVKPANILITGQTSHHPYLTDFGLSKRISSDTVVSGGTTLGAIVGTVDYMSPEQGQGHRIDARTDVYALGVTLFEALTGTVPYPRESDMAALAAKVLEPAPMVTQVAPGIPPPFDAVLARALAREPDERYPSAGELGRAARAAAGRPSEISVRREIGVGSVLADCLIEEVAGEGGMAVVYRATQQNLGKTVALKVMAPELADDPAFRARFGREMKLAAAIEHPNVIEIHWAGESQGRLYIVMRYVDGGTLREMLVRRGSLAPKLAVEVIEQLASGLDAAHAKGLAHRDIKPGNVLIDERSGRVYLTDFGLAKGIDDADITDGGQVLGTARYMPPERVRGAAVDDFLGDVYSLGCVLWDLLGGIDRVDLESIEDVPSALAHVVMRAASADPSARYSSAGELAHAARRALSEGAESDEDRVPSTVVRPSKLVVEERREPFEPTPLSHGLSERVLQVCDTVAGLIEAGIDGNGEGVVVPDEARLELEAIRSDLVAPLRIAVIGDAGSGRSTLINALLGRRLTETGGLAWLRTQITIEYGAQELVTAVLPGGDEVEYGLRPDGTLPDELRAMAGQLDSLHVRLRLDTVSTVSLIHASLTEEARETLPDASLYESADAFLITLRADSLGDVAELGAALSAKIPGRRISAVNATVVLTNADLAADGTLAQAEQVKDALGPMIAAATPLVGLLAETANAALVDNDDVAIFGELAAADPATRKGWLDSRETFLAGEAPIEQDERDRLLDRYGLHGIGCALELADAHQLDGIALRRRLREVSGIENVDRQIDGFHQRADALKADSALNRLEELSYRWPGLALLRDEVEAVRLQPQMHVIDLIRAFERCALDDVEVPEDLLQRLQRLITARSPSERLGISADARPDEMRAAALEGFRSWKMFENAGFASPVAARVARVAARAYEIVGDEAAPSHGAETVDSA